MAEIDLLATGQESDNSDILNLQLSDIENQYISFMLGGEEYGVSILSVQEIKSGESVTPIPKTPGYIRGVMNLRGAIVPIVDLRERFRVTAQQLHEVDVVVLLNVQTGDKQRTVGAIVDDVSDVYTVPEQQIKPAPDLGSAISTEFIRGIAPLQDRIVIMLDTERLFSLEELSRLDDLQLPESSDDGTETQHD